MPFHELGRRFDINSFACKDDFRARLVPIHNTFYFFFLLSLLPRISRRAKSFSMTLAASFSSPPRSIITPTERAYTVEELAAIVHLRRFIYYVVADI